MRGFLKIAGVLGLLGGLVILEHRRPLRAEKESKHCSRMHRQLYSPTLWGNASSPLYR